jgi:hypothetical protein
MWRDRRSSRSFRASALAVIITLLAVIGLGVGASPAHAATTTAVPANYSYDHPAEFAQRVFDRAVRHARPSGAPRSVRLQKPRASFSLVGRARVAAEAAGRVPWVVGKLPADEEGAVLQTLEHIDAGTKPTGTLAKKWGANSRTRPVIYQGPQALSRLTANIASRLLLGPPELERHGSSSTRRPEPPTTPGRTTETLALPRSFGSGERDETGKRPSFHLSRGCRGRPS